MHTPALPVNLYDDWFYEHSDTQFDALLTITSKGLGVDST